ncbi:MFS transporter [Streptomyces roseifaciens]|uniref:MFS transporter n=1 Tax=Streptomyces roseifaciens TaxID=1488406 RepID=UPI0007180735|nr:MFS transporter [Streptomyces roseifaciens]
MTVAPAEESLWRHRDFRRYWHAQAVDVTGNSITSVAIPLIAVVVLHATVMEAALLSFAEKLPPLLVALPAGALADRHRKRPITIGAALVNAAAFATIPVAEAAGHLTLGHLYVVALVGSTATVFGSIARISYLPALLPPGQLLEANSKLGGVSSLSDSAGAQLGGALVGVLGATRAIYVDVVSYVACAVLLGRIRTPEPASAPRREGSTHRKEIAEGVRYVVSHPTICPLLLTGTAFSAAFAFLNTLWALFLLRDLHFSALALGTAMSVAGLGGLFGALLVRNVVARWGPARVMLTALAAMPITELPLLLASPGLPGQIAITAGLFLQMACAIAQGSTQRSIRQSVCAPAMQGRMMATGQWITFGSRPLAALLAGASGTWIGLRPTLTLGTLALTIPFLVLFTSSLRSMHEVPTAPATALGKEA